MTLGIGRTIQLRFGIVATANHGEHFSCPRIQRDQRSLWSLTAGLVSLIEPIELMRNCVGRRSLKIKIQRGRERRHPSPDESGFAGIPAGAGRAIDRRSETIHIINEIRRDRLACGIEFSNRDRFLGCRSRLLKADRSIADHRSQDCVATRAGRVIPPDWRVVCGTLNQSGDRRSLRQGKVLQLFAEVNTRRLIDTAHREHASLSQENFVAVKRENIFFRQAPLDGESQHRFRELAPQGTLRCEISVFDKLLRDCRTALTDTLISGVSHQGASNPKDVDTVMIEESPVLNRSNRMHQLRRDVTERKLPARAAFRCAVG